MTNGIRRLCGPIALVAIVTLMGACDTAPVADSGADGCTPTLPGEGFAPPEPYPTAPVQENGVWFGTDDLWTVLAVDGEYAQRKSVWWSTSFPGGAREESPKIHVAWTRLDDVEVIDNGGTGTNAYTDDEGWFMIGGIDPETPGCWMVTATYKGASLSYVYEQR